MTNAAWVQTAWNANVNDGFFFTTTLKLLFPMDDSHSQFTTDGHDWMGTVSATGDVKVTATWVGVDRGYDEENAFHRIVRAVYSARFRGVL